jgi:hypothetical protein
MEVVTTDHESKEAFIARVRSILGPNETSPSVGAKGKANE